MNQLGNNIKKIREMRDYSQQYMALKIGISQPAYSLLEKSKIRISNDKLKKIADILEVAENVILNFSEKTVLQDTITIEKLNSQIKQNKETYEIILRNKDEEIYSLKMQLLK